MWEELEIETKQPDSRMPRLISAFASFALAFLPIRKMMKQYCSEHYCRVYEANVNI